jgi:hypothetical protein
MYKVLIIINAQQVSSEGTILSTSPATQRMVAAFKDAILTETKEETVVKIIAAHQLLHQTTWYNPDDSEWICCPLTIEVPPQFNFPRAQLFKACRNIKRMRQWVEQNLELKTGNQIRKVWHGNYWLPMVSTNKGPLYGEVIGETQLPNAYQQPIDFSDQKRQSLYRLGYQLLDSFSAQTGVYLLQFGFQEDTLIFDRVWPFPAAPALASVGIQKPNLYACHWQCLIQKPIRDLVISD